MTKTAHRKQLRLQVVVHFQPRKGGWNCCAYIDSNYRKSDITTLHNVQRAVSNMVFRFCDVSLYICNRFAIRYFTRFATRHVSGFAELCAAVYTDYGHVRECLSSVIESLLTGKDQSEEDQLVDRPMYSPYKRCYSRVKNFSKTPAKYIAALGRRGFELNFEKSFRSCFQSTNITSPRSWPLLYRVTVFMPIER